MTDPTGHLRLLNLPGCNPDSITIKGMPYEQAFRHADEFRFVDTSGIEDRRTATFSMTLGDQIVYAVLGRDEVRMVRDKLNEWLEDEETR